MAAAYSITGRESEMRAAQNLQRYDEYRAKSLMNMQGFLEKYPPVNQDDLQRERMLHVVRWMGNPHYEQGSGGQEAINQAEPREREQRHFIHRILTVAHKLDLPRCYGPEDFEQAMTMCLAQSSVSEAQKIHYLRMIRYAIDLIRAHGDMVCTDLSAEGVFQPCHEPYRTPFQRASTNLRQLREITDTVPRPKIKEKYQFSQNTNLDVQPEQFMSAP